MQSFLVEPSRFAKYALQQPMKLAPFFPNAPYGRPFVPERNRTGWKTSMQTKAATALYDYWTRQRGDRAMPLRSEIEKFRRVADDTIEYYITIDDATVWSKPWTLMIPLKRTGELMFEFACHEGNYSLSGILSGARAQEER